MIADGVERWKDADAEAVAAAMAGMDGETLTRRALRPRGGALKVPDGAAQGRQGRGRGGRRGGRGQAVAPARAGCRRARRELGLEIDKQAARALVAQVGDRQQRLLRELEKLALEHGPGAAIGVEEIEAVERILGRAQGVDARGRAGRGRRAGGDARAASSCAGRASACPGCSTRSSRRLRDARRRRRGAGGRPAACAGAPDAADAAARPPSGFMADVGKRDVEAFRRALEVMADLELESRGGGASGGALERGDAGRQARVLVAAA